MQAGLSAVLTLAPAVVLKKDRMRVSILLSFFAILSTCLIGGVIFAALVTVFLFLFSCWLRFLNHADSGAKRALFIISLVLPAIFLVLQVVHLPIRYALGQPPVKIAPNTAGIFLAAALVGGRLEIMIIRKRKNKETPEQRDGAELPAGGSSRSLNALVRNVNSI